MNNNQIMIGSGALIALGLIVYYHNEKRKAELELINSQSENKALKNIVIELKIEVSSIIDSKSELSTDLRKQLNTLIEDYKNIDEKITNELVSINSLLEIKEETRAILSLAKIIENLLKKLYKDDQEVKKNAKFSDLINHAKSKKIFNKEEVHFLNGIREIRNQEAHEVGVKKEMNIVLASILSGVAILFKLSAIVR
jgi:hypothetical protein